MLFWYKLSPSPSSLFTSIISSLSDSYFFFVPKFFRIFAVASQHLHSNSASLEVSAVKSCMCYISMFIIISSMLSTKISIFSVNANISSLSIGGKKSSIKYLYISY